MTTLEEAEEAHQQRLADLIKPAHPTVVVGKAQHQQNNDRRSSRGDSSVGEGDDVSTVRVVAAHRPTTFLWNRERPVGH